MRSYDCNQRVKPEDKNDSCSFLFAEDNFSAKTGVKNGVRSGLRS